MNPIRFDVKSALGMGLSALLALIFPWCLVKVIDDGVAAGNGFAVAFWLGCVVVSLSLSGIVRYIARRRVSRHSLDAEKQTLKHLYSRVFYADLREIPDHAHGELMGQILSAAAARCAFIETIYAEGVPLLCTAAGTFAALLALSWPLALGSVAICSFAALLLIWMRLRIRTAARTQYETQEKFFRVIVENFRAMISIRALHQTKKFGKKYDDLVDKRADATFDLQNKMAIQGPFLDVLQAIVLGIIFGVGGYGVLHSDLTIGVLVGFQIYLGRLFVFIRGASGIFGAYQHYAEGCARSEAIENMRPGVSSELKSAVSPELLRIEHLHFGFGDHVVWDDASLTICEGQLETILLPSGGGKTTLARCVLGLYPLEKGVIAVPDGNPETIGFVPQENVLFDGTIYDNISLMCDALEPSSYKTLLELCALTELADRFGEQTIGEQGMKLSGGEQRRVMLARALAGNPKLLIIDQMVSELEPELCRTIFSQIRKRYPRLGILYLGHRMPEL